MREDVAEGDRRPRRRRPVDILRERIVEPKLSVLYEQQDRVGRELLADRADLVNGLRGRGHAELEAGDTVPAALTTRPSLTTATETPGMWRTSNCDWT